MKARESMRELSLLFIIQYQTKLTLLPLVDIIIIIVVLLTLCPCEKPIVSAQTRC
jgi:hypothetical protein